MSDMYFCKTVAEKYKVDGEFPDVQKGEYHVAIDIDKETIGVAANGNINTIDFLNSINYAVKIILDLNEISPSDFILSLMCLYNKEAEEAEEGEE